MVIRLFLILYLDKNVIQTEKLRFYLSRAFRDPFHYEGEPNDLTPYFWLPSIMGILLSVIIFLEKPQ